MDELKEKLKDLIVKSLELKDVDLLFDTLLFDPESNLGLDSIDFLAIANMVNHEFGIELPGFREQDKAYTASHFGELMKVIKSIDTLAEYIHANTSGD